MVLAWEPLAGCWARLLRCGPKPCRLRVDITVKLAQVRAVGIHLHQFTPRTTKCTDRLHRPRAHQRQYRQKCTAPRRYQIKRQPQFLIMGDQTFRMQSPQRGRSGRQWQEIRQTGGTPPCRRATTRCSAPRQRQPRKHSRRSRRSRQWLQCQAWQPWFQ